MATTRTAASLPPDSVVDPEDTPSESAADVVTETIVNTTSEAVGGRSISSSVPPAESSGSSAPSQRRDKKRAREGEDDSATIAGPSTKASSTRDRIDASYPDTNQQRRTEVKLQGPFPCTLGDCQLIFARNTDLKRHQKSSKAHATRAYECPGCQSTFVRSSAFGRHYLREDSAKCKEALRELGGYPTWTATMPLDMLATCEVPHVPEVGPSPKE